VQDKV